MFHHRDISFFIEDDNIEEIKRWIQTTVDIDAIYEFEDDDVDEDEWSRTYWTNPVLLTAVYYQKFDIVKLLLQNGADVNVKSNSGNTALYEAVENQDVEMVRFLLENGADPNLKGEYNKTPLFCAVTDKSHYNQLLIVKMLLEKGAKPNVKEESVQLTPLEAAEQRAKHEVMELLKKYS